MSRKQLTVKQLAFLEYLAEHVRRTRVWPTYREIVEQFGYRSPNSVTQNLQALEKKGYLVRDENGYRLIGDRSPLPGGFPVQGRIADGDFQVSLSAEEVTLRDLFPGLSDVYAIRLEQGVRGIDVDAGDYLLVGDGMRDGEMAVALLDGEAAVCHVTQADGITQLRFPDGSSRSISDGGAVRFLGRYAGHINRSGLYRSPKALASATA
jgi:repressor LexA